jgi:hypothetical protein
MAHVLDGHIKTAALLEMCPHDLQDMASQAIKRPDDHVILRDVVPRGPTLNVNHADMIKTC